MRRSDRLSINLATVREQWDMREAVAGCLRHGITAIAPWRDQVAAIGLDRAAQLVGTTACGSPGSAAAACSRRRPPRPRARAIDDNRRAIDEAAALRADCLVLVVGGLPEGSKDIAAAREMVARRHRRDPAARPRRQTCRSRSSRCIRCTPPTAPA